MEVQNPNEMKVSDLHDVETQDSPSTVPLRQQDLKIIIDDFPDENSQKEFSKKFKGSLDSIEKSIEEIKTLSKKRRVSGNLTDYYTCHSCLSLLDKKYLLKCSDAECARFFCLRCANKKYRASPEDVLEMKEMVDWKCFSCLGSCNCRLCKDRFYGKVELFPSQLITFERSKKKPSYKKEDEEPQEPKPKIVEVKPTEIKSPVEPKEIKLPKKKEEPVKEKLIEQPKETPKEPKNEGPKKNNKKRFKSTEKKSIVSEPEIVDIKVPEPVIQDEQSQNDLPPIPMKRRLKRLVHMKEDDGDRLDTQNDSESTKEDINEVPNEVPVETPPVKKKRGGWRGRRSTKVNEECHLCEKLYEDTNMLRCTIPDCKNSFCVFCIQEKFQKNFNPRKCDPTQWICYSCGKVCKCRKCLKPSRITALKRRAMKGEARTGSNRRRGRARRKMGEKKAVKYVKYYDDLSDVPDDSSVEGEYYTPFGNAFMSTSLPDLKNPFDDKLNMNVMEYEKDLEEELLDEAEGADDEDKESYKLVNTKFIDRKKRLKKAIEKKDIDNSKIISEINIDSACFTLYAFEDEEQLKAEIQKKVEKAN